MIYVCGDTHGIIDNAKLDSWEEGKTLTKEDYVIILGDSGLIWNKDYKERKTIAIYNNYPWTTLFIDGNHCNFDRLFAPYDKWMEFPDIPYFNSSVKRISDSIYYLKRGHIYQIEDISIFTFGGASSIDKEYRTNHVSWWRQEIPTEVEKNYGLKFLELYNYDIDFVLTHTCPESIYNKLLSDRVIKKDIKEEKSFREYLDIIKCKASFREWHFGHFHIDEIVDDKYFAHYNFYPRKLI